MWYLPCLLSCLVYKSDGGQHAMSGSRSILPIHIRDSHSAGIVTKWWYLAGARLDTDRQCYCRSCWHYDIGCHSTGKSSTGVHYLKYLFIHTIWNKILISNNFIKLLNFCIWWKRLIKVLISINMRTFDKQYWQSTIFHQFQ